MSDDNDRAPTRRMPRPRKSTTRRDVSRPSPTSYSLVTRRSGPIATRERERERELDVVTVGQRVELRSHNQVMTLTRTDARRLLSILLEKLG